MFQVEAVLKGDAIFSIGVEPQDRQLFRAHHTMFPILAIWESGRL